MGIFHEEKKMKIFERADWEWLGALATELEMASQESRGGKVFFDQERVDDMASGIRSIMKAAVDKPEKVNAK